MDFFDIIGWLGTVMVLLSYILLSLNIIKNGKLYQILNFFGAACLAIGLFPKNAWFSFFMQIIWGLIALVALIKMIVGKKKNND